ncbi:hypothetical protein GDO86_019021 [Hymenochirus boettgeri]|uniref:TIL domain-containing protein n=1 Tax=Hymenochirus boettgeri TaxID=247094 RepID=A0A8T2IDS5_9PIPI|nr:hypothetical protein GDO86_019021 [Hymenochirus boettgeri]
MLRVCTALLICAVALNVLFSEVKGDCPYPHQIQKQCGPLCPPNCDNYKYDSIPCPLICVSGCFCNDGYVFQSGRSGPCVPTSECP